MARVEYKEVRKGSMLKTVVILLAFLFLVWLAIYLFYEIPVDCFPRIGGKPITSRILETFFRTKCVTF